MELMSAVKNGDVERVKGIIEQPGCDINAELSMGRNAMHYAADSGQLKCIELLLEKGANVNAPDKHGITPLLSAIYEDYPDCVKYMLDNGAGKDGKAPDGTSYVDCAQSEEIKSLLR